MRLATCSTSASPQREDRPSRREPFAVIGWPLKPLTRLDQEGARGCSADLATAGLLSRQAAFVTLACVDLDHPQPFLACLGITAQGAAGIGEALRTRSARNLVAAAFAVPSSAVPIGYLRALMRVRENRLSPDGSDPFAEPGTYRRLWEIFTAEPESPKAMALRFCGPLTSATIAAVDELDPVLLHAEVLKHLTSPERVAKANALLALLRGSL
ncbi:hypothetical protein [Methylobacterium planeticum]|uniref:Uncharacterized protein n=1 Tax=Methylobacterium planeticum TaxID=2615211 RepID=A0A6N6MLI1_9HYPH|nr:hypothetical protein [Methylobacterium planeticum]KAB1070020.1 hypothetical protein F6X51_23900 [Methylobacterium planeticum]